MSKRTSLTLSQEEFKGIEKKFLSRLEECRSGEKLNLVVSYFDSAVAVGDVKTILFSIKTCLRHCATLEIDYKNDPRLLEFFIKISRFFKSQCEFFGKIHQQGFFQSNPKFYDVWISTLKSEQQHHDAQLVQQIKLRHCSPPQPRPAPRPQTKAVESGLLTPLMSALVALPVEWSMEEVRAGMYLSNLLGGHLLPTTIGERLGCLETLEARMKSYVALLKPQTPTCPLPSSGNKHLVAGLECRAPVELTTDDMVVGPTRGGENDFDDTVNQTLLKVRPLPPGSTPTVNTREAMGFIEDLCQKPAFDSSEESEDFFTKLTCQKEEGSPSTLHKSLNVNDVWTSPGHTAKCPPETPIPEGVRAAATTTTLTSGYATMSCGESGHYERAAVVNRQPAMAELRSEAPFAKFKLKMQGFHKDAGGASESAQTQPECGGDDTNDALHQQEETFRINFQNLQSRMCTSTPGASKAPR